VAKDKLLTDFVPAGMVTTRERRVNLISKWFRQYWLDVAGKSLDLSACKYRPVKDK
jgi:hypothetical protein